MQQTESQKPIKNSILAPIALVVLTCLLPGFYLYANNAYEVPFADVLLPMGVSLAIGALVLLALKLLVKDMELAALLTAAAMMLFLNFNFVVDLCDKIFANARVRVYYLAALLLFALLTGIILLLYKRKICQIANRLLLIAAAVVLVMNLVTAVPDVIRKLNATSYTSGGTDETAREDLPNFYYLIADEYASFDEIEKYYQYDNSAFHTFLTERGFCVSDSSFNYAANTMRSVADNVNLSHVATDEMRQADYIELVNNGTLYGILEKLGYDLSQLSTVTLYPLPKLLENSSFSLRGGAETMGGESAAEILLKNSMLMPIPQILYWNKIEASGDLALFEYLEDDSHYAVKNNRAIFFYICSPHPPFYYGADGTEVEEAHWNDWTDTSYYLGQYQYITGRLEGVIETILENDPGAIILLQSDHGCRFHDDSDLPHTFSIDDPDQRQILNALYFGGKTVDIQGLSGYNTLRVILSELGLSYPVLPE